jgi:hypothetical protein
MIRRAPVAAAAAAAVLAAVALAGAAPVRSAHAQAGPASRSAHLAAKSSPRGAVPHGDAGAPGVNLTLYRLCANPRTYVGERPIAVSTFVAGYSDANKLDGALRVGFPALALVRSEGAKEGLLITSVPLDNDLINCSLITLSLDYDGERELPPVTATFLGFGFAPVTATAIISQDGAPLTVVVYQNEGSTAEPDSSRFFSAISVARLSIRLTNVQVNGVPLNVGPSCRTSGDLYTPGNPVAPTELMLVGGTYPGDPVPSFGAALFGGTVAGESDIPPFTGCITPSGENLDPLLTASVSGAGNFMRITAAALCPYSSACTPSGLPTLHDTPLWTVTHGGQYSASAPLTFTAESNSPIAKELTITCPRSQISGVFPDVTGPLRGGLATVSWKIGGCTGTGHSTWQIVQQGTAYFGPKFYGQEGLAPGDTSGNFDQLAFELTGTNTGAPGACHVFVAGYQPVLYSNLGSTLTTPSVGQTLNILSSSCPDAPPDGNNNASGDFGISGTTYSLKPGGITITSP